MIVNPWVQRWEGERLEASLRARVADSLAAFDCLCGRAHAFVIFRRDPKGGMTLWSADEQDPFWWKASDATTPRTR